MARLDRYTSLALAGWILLAGCGKPTTPTTVEHNERNAASGVAHRLEPRLLSADLVVAASHDAAIDSRRPVESDYVNARMIEAIQPARLRLPPVPPTPQYPDTASPARVYSKNHSSHHERPNIAQQRVGYPDTAVVDTGYPDTVHFSAPAKKLERLPRERLPREHLPPVGPRTTTTTSPLANPWRQTMPTVPVSLVPASEESQDEETQGEEPEEKPHAQLLPQRRVLPQKPPKPKLPPLAPQANGRVLGGAGTHNAAAALATVADRVDKMTGRAFALAERGALYSAKAEFHQALRAIAQSLGAQSGSKRYSTALAFGLQALDEADDFATHAQHGPVVDVQLIVDAHQTPLLKPYDLATVPPVVAMQRYYLFAQEQLVMACGGAPVAARVYYGLGKLHMVLGKGSAMAERLQGPKAMAFQQTALILDPMNYLAANELGVLLARFGKYPEARAVLQHSLAIRPLPETWQNLSVVHRELGEMQLADQSLANWQYAVQQRQPSGSQQTAAAHSIVQWVPPQQFMGRPNDPIVGPSPPGIQERQPEQAKQKTGFLWW